MDPPSEVMYDAKFKEPSRFGSPSELQIRNDTAQQMPRTVAADDGGDGNRLEPPTGNTGEVLLKQPHGSPSPKHPVWRYFSRPQVLHEQKPIAHRRSVAQSRIVVVCTFCHAKLERDTALSKDATEPSDEIAAMRAILHDMVRHLKEDCERCPKKLRQEMVRWPLIPIPFGNEGRTGKSPPPPVDAPPVPTVGEHATRFSRP